MKYDAFISYRHAELDLYIAKKLHKGLETFKVPRAVAKKSGKKKIKRVFRDQEELPIGSDLGDNIESALAESEYLLVVCSPRTPQSYWVQKEISTFIQMHDREHVLAVLTEGEPEESFPALLLTDENGNPVEPLAADVRGAAKREINRKLRTEIMRLAAPLLSCSYDDLRQRHRERRMKKVAALSGAVAALAVAFASYSAYNAALIQSNYEGKQRNQSKYLAETSLRLLEEGDRRAAVLVALEALPDGGNDRPYVAEAQYALSQALYCYDTGNRMRMDRILQHDLPVREFSVNEEGTKVLSIDQGETISVFDLENGEKLAQISPKIDENGYLVEIVGAFLYEGHIIICQDDGLRSVTFDSQEEWRTQNPAGAIYCMFDQTTRLAACVSNEAVVFFDITSGELVCTMPNLQESSYSSAMAFSADGTRFALSHLVREEGAEAGCVSLYDFATGTVTDIATAATYIAEMAFTMDGHLIVAEYSFEEASNFEQSVLTGYLQKIDCQDQSTLWQNTYECQVLGTEAASARIKCRSYQDPDTGKQHDEVLLSVDNKAYTWDNETGERIAGVQVDNGIVNFLVAQNSCYGYLAQSDGTIDIADMTAGVKYPTVAIETGKVLRDAAIQNGMIVMRAYASPDLTVMKYQEGSGMVRLEEYGDTIMEVDSSKGESYYAVRLYDTHGITKFRFYRTEDNSFVGEWSCEEDSYSQAWAFVSDTCYAVVCLDGTVFFYDVESGEGDKLTVEEWFLSTKCSMNEEASMAFLYTGKQYCVVDLLQKSVLFTGETQEYIRGAVLSGDGRHAYCSIQENNVVIMDTETGTMTEISPDGYQVPGNVSARDAFAVSKDGSLLAVSCQDGVLRVLSLEKMETVAEIPFMGINRRFIRFTEDNTQLMLQGDDYYFRVYDLDTGEFIHISTDQYYEIRQAVADEASGTVSLITSSDMVILNKEDYERTAQIDGGGIYLPGHAKILCSQNRTMYQFPYRSLETLIQEAEEQFGAEALTGPERTRFHVE